MFRLDGTSPFFSYSTFAHYGKSFGSFDRLVHVNNMGDRTEFMDHREGTRTLPTGFQCREKKQDRSQYNRHIRACVQKLQQVVPLPHVVGLYTVRFHKVLNEGQADSNNK